MSEWVQFLMMTRFHLCLSKCAEVEEDGSLKVVTVKLQPGCCFDQH